MKPQSPVSALGQPFRLAPLLALAATLAIAACSTTRYSIGEGGASVHNIVATAQSIAPGLEVKEVEREVEFGKVSWTVEGVVRGQEIEIEFEEEDLISPVSGKSVAK